MSNSPNCRRFLARCDRLFRMRVLDRRWVTAGLLTPVGFPAASNSANSYRKFMTDATIKSDDTAGKSFAYTFAFHPVVDGTVPEGAYELRFLIDHQMADSKPIALTR